MSFSLHYASTRVLSEAEADAIRVEADRACEGRDWLSAEPVNFFPGLHHGKLLGGSKPNFIPHPEDEASAATSGLPDGTLRDVVDILCRLSKEHAVDWQLTHDYGEVGLVRSGVPDPGVLEQIDALGTFGDELGEIGED